MKVLLDDGAYMPNRAYESDAGYDLRSMVNRYIYPNEQSIFDTGVHIQIPQGYCGLMVSKSGLMSKGITSRGLIDSGYTGSIRVVLYNNGDKGYMVNQGDKISQLVILPILTPELEQVTNFDSTERGSGGFGSTGK